MSTMHSRLLLCLLVAGSCTLAACSSSSNESTDMNPLLSESTLPLQAPDFEAITPNDYRPAFEKGMDQELQQMDSIATLEAAPTFENTIVAMEKSGPLLRRTAAVFFNLTSANTNDSLQAIQAAMAPKLAAHSDDILLNPDLFARVQTLYEQRDALDLSTAEHKLLTDTYREFVRAGAQLSDEEKARMREINKELSSLTTEFQDNLLALNDERAVFVDDTAMLAGLSDDRLAAAREAAGDSDKGTYKLTITNTTRVPLLQELDNRAMRERLWKASANRGVGHDGGIDNRPLIKQIVSLRAEKAELLGYANFAAYKLEPQTAKTPKEALDMLRDLVDPVTANTDEERAAIKAMMADEGVNGAVQPWDWNYYAEKVRKAEFNIDQSQVRPYFELDRVLNDGVFFAMNKLYGISFEERTDLPVYHPDVRVFDVLDADGSQIGLYYVDFFEREGKRGGAWMNSYVSQSGLLNQQPVVSNVLNIPKPAEGDPALISFDNVTTMFHEMGHAMHGLFSKVRYPSQSGTSVPRDFVEFPSTFNGDWAIQSAVLNNYAKHYQTGEAIPEALLQKVIDARNFNQGFDTQEYLGATLLDMQWHLLGPDDIPDDVMTFEKQALGEYGLDSNIIMPRYRSPYFAHIFSGGYAANYYAYIWSEVLAADAFAYMQEQGGLKRANGDRFRKYILSQGGSDEAMQLYENYRGQEPDVSHLLERRGLDAE